MTPEQTILYDIARGLAALVTSNLVIAVAAWIRTERRITRLEVKIEGLEIDVAEAYKDSRKRPRSQ